MESLSEKCNAGKLTINQAEQGHNGQVQNARNEWKVATLMIAA